MGRQDPRYLAVGHINKPHGTKGELFVWPLTDHPESVYVAGALLAVGDAEGGTDVDPASPPLRISSVREFRRGFLVSFEGVRSREGAEALTGRYLLRETDALAPLAEGEVFYHQLLGLEVLTTAGERVGEVVEVYELAPADMLEVRGPAGDVMIPFLESIVVEIDHERGRLVIDPPEGLLEL